MWRSAGRYRETTTHVVTDVEAMVTAIKDQVRQVFAAWSLPSPYLSMSKQEWERGAVDAQTHPVPLERYPRDVTDSMNTGRAKLWNIWTESND